MISSKVTPQNSGVEISHEHCSDSSPYESLQLYIESENSKNNTLTTITLNGIKIFVFWESFTSAEFFEVLYLTENDLLFIGCGSVSARIDLHQSLVLDVNNVCLFWEFKTLDKYILETGELDCFLYDLNGILVSKTIVDPPYDMEITELGIKFNSIAVGETWLRFSENG